MPVNVVIIDALVIATLFRGADDGGPPTIADSVLAILENLAMAAMAASLVVVLGLLLLGLLLLGQPRVELTAEGIALVQPVRWWFVPWDAIRGGPSDDWNTARPRCPARRIGRHTDARTRSRFHRQLGRIPS